MLWQEAMTQLGVKRFGQPIWFRCLSFLVACGLADALKSFWSTTSPGLYLDFIFGMGSFFFLISSVIPVSSEIDLDSRLVRTKFGWKYLGKFEEAPFSQIAGVTVTSKVARDFQYNLIEIKFYSVKFVLKQSHQQEKRLRPKMLDIVSGIMIHGNATACAYEISKLTGIPFLYQ
jgi:hypothetical protein